MNAVDPLALTACLKRLILMQCCESFPVDLDDQEALAVPRAFFNRLQVPPKTSNASGNQKPWFSTLARSIAGCPIFRKIHLTL